MYHISAGGHKEAPKEEYLYFHCLLILLSLITYAIKLPPSAINIDFSCFGPYLYSESMSRNYCLHSIFQKLHFSKSHFSERPQEKVLKSATKILKIG